MNRVILVILLGNSCLSRKGIPSYLNLFSYKAAGANNTDEYGNLDTVEFIKCVKLTC